MQHRLILILVASASLAGLAASCDRGGGGGDDVDFTDMELTAASLPASPTNLYADDPAAAALGQRLFFDRGLSSDGTVACVDCHVPDEGFSDANARSIGVRGQTGDRHSMPVTAAVMHPFLLWDGKADSAWSQPLKALENPKEMDFTRVEVARRIAEVYRSEYEATFGPLPDLTGAPARGRPGDAAWASLSEGQKDEVQRVFANVGKAIEAYERKLLCQDTRFDRWVRGEVELTDAERAGANTFQRENCARCHSGPSFSDGRFHNVGIPSPDRGRSIGAEACASDTFNGAGPYSDDPAAGLVKLQTIASETGQEGAFRTASLRGVGQRTFFGHAAHEQTLRGFILDVYRGGRAGGGRGRGDGNRGEDGATVGTRDELLDGVNVDDDDVDDLVAFLRTLDCPELPSELLGGP